MLLVCTQPDFHLLVLNRFFKTQDEQFEIPEKMDYFLFYIQPNSRAREVLFRVQSDFLLIPVRHTEQYLVYCKPNK